MYRGKNPAENDTERILCRVYILYLFSRSYENVVGGVFIDVIVVVMDALIFQRLPAPNSGDTFPGRGGWSEPALECLPNQRVRDQCITKCRSHRAPDAVLTRDLADGLAGCCHDSSPSRGRVREKAVYLQKTDNKTLINIAQLSKLSVSHCLADRP